MTIYAGESLEITSSATTFAGGVINSGSAVTVTTTIYDPDGVEVVNAAALTWNNTESLWIYEWDTTGMSPGTYVAKVTFAGPGPTVSWEYRSIRLTKNRVSA